MVEPSALRSDLVSAIHTLSNAKIEFIIVGATGINFFLPKNEPPLATVDIDIFVAPEVVVLQNALHALTGIGFEFEVNGEPFVDINDFPVLENVIKSGSAIRAYSGGAYLDLMLSMKGFCFSDISNDAVPFMIEGQIVRVGKLEKLLYSKKLANREKDKEFLRAFTSRFKRRRSKKR